LIRAGEALLGETMTMAQAYAPSGVTLLGDVLIWSVILFAVAVLLYSGRP